MERSIESSEDAYAAIESMLSHTGDPYTRLLRPEDYAALKNSTNGSLSGVGLQLGPRKQQWCCGDFCPRGFTCRGSRDHQWNAAAQLLMVRTWWIWDWKEPCNAPARRRGFQVVLSWTTMVSQTS